MISHDTQLCLTEPEGAREMEREEQDKEREDEGKKESLRKSTEGGGGKTDIQLFLREATVHLSKTASHSKLVLSIRARVLLPQAVDMQFADVHTKKPGPKKSGNESVFIQLSSHAN